MKFSDCTITWNTLSPQEWEDKFALITRSNLLQSYDYARAICPLRRMRARWGLIIVDGQEAGLVQMLEAGFMRGLVQAFIIDRGPLWFDGYGSSEHFDAFLRALIKDFPRRIGRRYRFIAEYQDNQHVRMLMQQAGFKLVTASPYETIWLDLTQATETLHQALRKNWRNMLSRAQRSGLEVYWHEDNKALHTLLKHYAADKMEKGYSGASIKTIVALAAIMLPRKKMLIGTAYKDGNEVASVLLLLHGQSATYQIGWASKAGRECGAQNLLLWDALAQLKQKGIRDLDLGGINEDSAKGVKAFKDGMGGRTVTLSGIYTG